MSSINQNVKSVQTSELVNFIKSANLLAQADILSISKLFRSVCTLFSFSQNAHNVTPEAYPLYSAAIPANLFVDDGDAIDLYFCLNVRDDDEDVKFSFSIGGFHFYATETLGISGNIIFRAQIMKFGVNSLRFTGDVISAAQSPQVLATFTAGTGAFDFTAPLQFVITGEAIDDSEAYAQSGKIYYSPA